MTERDSNATEIATARDSNGDTATPDDGAEIFAAIDCSGTTIATASATAPATLGAFWPHGMPATSESISSPSSIVARLDDAALDRVVLANLSRVGAHVDRWRAVALLPITPPAPGTSAGLSAGIGARPLCGCGKPNDRWKPGVKNQPRSCSECNRESVAKCRAAKAREQDQRDRELEEARAELARLKQPAE